MNSNFSLQVKTLILLFKNDPLVHRQSLLHDAPLTENLRCKCNEKFTGDQQALTS